VQLPIENKDEAQTLLSMLDVATKAGGLQVAPVCLHFAGKIQTMLQADAQPKPQPSAEAPQE